MDTPPPLPRYLESRHWYSFLTRCVEEILHSCLAMVTSLFPVPPSSSPQRASSPQGVTEDRLPEVEPHSGRCIKQQGTQHLDHERPPNKSNRLLRRLTARSQELRLTPNTRQDNSGTMGAAPDTLRSQAFMDMVNHLSSNYGNVGLSVGHLDGSNSINMNFGTIQALNDGDCGEAPTKDTVYMISSMSKPIIALAIAIMVNDEKYDVELTTHIKDILPELAGRTSLRHANRELTIADLLDNRTEFPKCTNFWESPEGDMPWKTVSPILALLGKLPPSGSFKTANDFANARNYCNEGFALAATIVEKKTGTTWAEFIRHKILQPLGMSSTIAGLTNPEERDRSNRFAKSHSVSVKEPLEELRHRQSDLGSSFEYDPVQVKPSQVTHAAEDLKSTPLGAAAGIMSSVTDLLKFYCKFIDIYHYPVHRKSGVDLKRLPEVERGMVTVQRYIESMVQSTTCAYAAGWSTAMVPWETEHASPRPRWPGADGDNARRLEKAMGKLGKNEADIYRAWPFFQQTRLSEDQRLTLHHGGNMVGATSFCMLDLERKRATVVLSNTRGFVVDIANLVGMTMATYDEPAFEQRCEAFKVLAKSLASSYLWDVCHYEQSLTAEFPQLADPEAFKACVGTYQIAEGVFAMVSKGKHSTFEDPSGIPCLQFRLYGNGYPYPLRVSKGAFNSDQSIKMTFAMSMAELAPLGVGGNNRLDAKDFHIEFCNKNDDAFERFVWVVDRTILKTPDVDASSVYAFVRTANTTLAIER
ncbi:beta-lactamase/transpeptidase-like protein [Lasiosphaeris hirsuta]|uniref:Beta-lactamase/transpeptidase-like protein n=1 Tax=Lasiosphaeris hirsuta TaxID=260670 RepID=A0AA40DQ70_9PEZI|nr:beta-lactamase/transpeptidase-like protein [Lasiosphaeris hirsuta]